MFNVLGCGPPGEINYAVEPPVRETPFHQSFLSTVRPVCVYQS